MIDFQLCCRSSVVVDLSYLVYSGATKTILDNLEHYLKIYYKTFSNTLTSFNLDPQTIFSFEDLQREWKIHSKFGFIIGQLVWRTKLSTSYEKNNLIQLQEAGIQLNVDTDDVDKIMAEKYDTDLNMLNSVCFDIIMHLHDNDYL